MAVFRIERTRDYTVMSNHHLRNANLSLKAKGLLSMIHLPDDGKRKKPSFDRHYPCLFIAAAALNKSRPPFFMPSTKE